MNESNQKPQVVLIGAAGRMGRAISARFLTDNIVDFIGAVDQENIGENTGTISGCSVDGPQILDSVDKLPDAPAGSIVLDFSIAHATRKNIEPCLIKGYDYLIGATGFHEEDYIEMKILSTKYNRRIVLVPNFTIGANILFKFVKDAAAHFQNVEIIELHHDKKLDAPSGTAVYTSGLIASVREKSNPPGLGDQSRGNIINGVPIHAVRLPGLLAHQEVIFGSAGEVLTIRHDSTDRSAFLSGIYLALRKMYSLEPGFYVGLDWAL